MEAVKRNSKHRYCCINGCTAKTRKSENVTFYNFPSMLISWKQVKRNMWIEAVRKYKLV